MAPAKKATSRKRRTTTMSDEHKEALARGRLQGRAIRTYLEALEQHRPKRGRKRTEESIRKRLDRIEEELAAADPMKRVQLIQERIDLHEELEGFGQVIDLSALEADFIEHAWEYSQSKGITRDAWRQVGIAPSVLREAGFG